MKRQLLTTLSLLAALMVSGQTQDGQPDVATVSGSIQSDMLFPQSDCKIGAERNGNFNTNSYADILVQSRYVDGGARFEYLDNPLPGFESDFKGMGLPNAWLKFKYKENSLTLGTFYEQFGSGFILRTYEERSLGIDNSLLGARLVVEPVEGVRLKALTGIQRRYWEWNESLISGADAELNIDQWIPSMQEKGTRLMLGASWVNKYDNTDYKFYSSPTYRYRFPKYVNAWDVRASLNHGPWSVLAEYAQKEADPSFDNQYIYRRGSAALLSASYSQKGLSVLLQAKRSENMSFKSTNDGDKTIGISSTINHLPAFTQDQTYALAALYPYATQLAKGEWAYQAEVGYNFKRKTLLGGRYGMNLKVNYSYIRAIEHKEYDTTDPIQKTNGYSSSFFKWGDQTYYQDLDVTLTRKFSQAFKLSLMYMNQRYNQAVVEGHGDMIHADIFVADGKYQFSPKLTLRGEVQYLTTGQDKGDWAYGLLELSVVPHWMLTVSDLWNCGETNIHYYQGLVTYNVGQHRIQAGYGRTRAGYNCSGGVCRYLPATKGFTVSYNYNF